MLDLQYTNVSSYQSLTEIEKYKIDCYLLGLIQGALSMSKRFSTSDLVGGINTDWTFTPLNPIYMYHVNRNVKCPEAEAGKDIGRLVKNCMINDVRHKYKVDGKVQRRYKSNLYSYAEN